MGVLFSPINSGAKYAGNVKHKRVRKRVIQWSFSTMSDNAFPVLPMKKIRKDHLQTREHYDRELRLPHAYLPLRTCVTFESE